LKIARGNPGQRRLPANEPQPAPAFDLTVPDILRDDAGARAEWERTAPRLQRVGLLTEVDLDALTLYCATFARWKAAERELQQHGVMVTVGKKKKPTTRVSPYLMISMKAQQQCRALLMEFGLTPVSRSRVHVPKPDTANAQRDRFFGPVAVPRAGA
jgi:P27 family predicted phage terminase small subunit